MSEYDITQEQQSPLGPFLHLPAGTVYGVITASPLLQRFLLAIAQASLTERELRRPFGFDMTAIRKLIHTDLPDDQLLELLHTQIVKDSQSRVLVQGENGEWEMFPVWWYSGVRDNSVLFAMNDYFADLLTEGPMNRVDSAPPLYDCSATSRLYAALKRKVSDGIVEMTSEELNDIFNPGSRDNMIPIPPVRRFSRYRAMYDELISPMCKEISALYDINVVSVDPIGENWEKAFSKNITTRFRVEPQLPAAGVPLMEIGCTKLGIIGGCLEVHKQYMQLRSPRTKRGIGPRSYSLPEAVCM